METSVEQLGAVFTVHIAGSVDGVTAEPLQQVFARELEAGHHQLSPTSARWSTPAAPVCACC